MERKVQKLLDRLGEVEQMLGHAELISEKKRYRELTQEHSHLSQVKEVWFALLGSRKQLAEARSLLDTETDPEFVAIVKEDIAAQDALISKLEKKLENLIIPPDPQDSLNVILEFRAGTGGDEAALFVGDCVRMYKLYADSKEWKYELLSCTPAEVGGFKEYIMVLSGAQVYRYLRYEAGTHRVQRVPDTETQGRVHTSAITMAVLLEPDEEELIEIDEKDLRIDTYRSSGAGGQHVNTTDSAIRITHLPTNTVVSCQEERSQHKNKDKAMRLLQAKLVEEQRNKAQKEQAHLRSSQVGSGDRSERIRTYNFSQNRVTDHRIDLTLYKLDKVMNGDLDDITEALIAHFYQKRLEGEA